MRRSNSSFAARSLAVVCATAIAIAASSVFVRAQESGANKTQASMRAVFQNLMTAYRLSLDPDVFQDPANNETIKSALLALVSNVTALETHSSGLDPSFEYLKRSLAHDAGEAYRRFDKNEFTGARFVLGQLTENCFTCHTKLPAEHQFDLGKALLAEAEWSGIDPAARVKIEVATRQFQKARDTYETIIGDPKNTPQTLTMVGAFEGYFRVCIGALADPRRPIATLERFSSERDLPDYQRELVSAWIKSLKEIDLQTAKGKEFQVGRQLTKEAEMQREYPSDRRGLVKFIAATTLLHRFLSRDPDDLNNVAEAYYLLAVAESYISRSYWVSETDFLLAQAIRTAPKSPIARRAYAFLEQYTLSGHAVTARSVPEELKSNLEELRELIEK